MSAPLILHPTELTLDQMAELKEIFFESSAKKEFKDQKEKDDFFWKYLGFYLVNFPDYVWIARLGRILGYVVGAPITNDPQIYEIQPHLKSFEAFFNDYPAHLHINCHAEARGLGVGSKLLKELENKLQEAQITGLHIMTSPESRNKNFYKRLGFDFEVTLNSSGSPILLMGKRF